MWLPLRMAPFMRDALEGYEGSASARCVQVSRTACKAAPDRHGCRTTRETR